MPTQIRNDLATWSETEPETDEEETPIIQKQVVRISLHVYLDAVIHMNQAKEPNNNKVYPPSHILVLLYVVLHMSTEKSGG
jgi:hypothetical protein